MKIKFLFTRISAALLHQLTFAQAYMKVGSYDYTATDGSYTWNGTILINKNSCTHIQLP